MGTHPGPDGPRSPAQFILLDAPMTPDELAELASIADKLLIGHFHRHVFLCLGPTCCASEAGDAAWDALKRELKDRNLSLATGPAACYRTKVGCLRVCKGGPVLVVYPDGTWYAGITADRVPRFVEEHLVGGRPVEEWVFARNPLPKG
jgi:(2Fe-2S) ferredoxin